MKNSKLDYEIKERYVHEIRSIENILNKLEKGRVYELSKVRTDGSLSKNIQDLRKELEALLCKIQNGEQGFKESVESYIK